jgi:WD repeat-containing protein 1 (actin-interacting protein 1)
MASNSNASISPSAPVTIQVPPLPTTTRGEACALDGDAGRLNEGKGLLCYASGKLAIVRSLTGTPLPNSKHSVLAYRGHQYATSCVKLSTSGTYAASGDTRGKLRVWSLDHEEHLCKLDTQGLTASIRDISWDGESKRIAFAGERLDGRSECTRAIQWDTGVTQGTLYQHLKGQSCAVSFKPNRPFRVVTGGKEDGKCHLHKGPPFLKMPVENGVPCETAHTKGVNCVRYSADGELVASTGGDKSVCIYDGKDMVLKTKLENVHTGTIYALAFSGNGKQLLTASADGTCKLLEIGAGGASLKEVHTWKVAEAQLGKPCDKTPKGGLQLGCAFVNGNIPVSVSTNNQLAILPMPGDSKSIEIITGHNASVNAVAFDLVNGLFYTGDSDGILCKWDLKSPKALKRIEPKDNSDLTYQVHGGTISCMTILSDSRMMSMGWDDKAMFTSPTGNLEYDKTEGLPAQPTAASTGDKLTAILTVKGFVLMKGGTTVSKDVIPLAYTGNCVLVAPDDKTIYVGGDNCKVYVYEVTGDAVKEKHVIDGVHLKPVHCLALSHNGKMLAAGDVRDLCVYDLADSYKPIINKSRWCFHLQKLTTIAWSPDDQVLATGGQDDSIYLWSLEKKMKRIHYQYAHRGGVVGLTFQKDSNKIVSVGMDSCVVEWDATNDIKTTFA